MRYTISIADDEPRVRTGLRSLITSRGAEWEVSGLFPNGRAALDAVAARRTDVILADIRMPGLDGLSLATALQAAAPDTVVVVMSGFKEFDYARRAMKIGVLDFLVKPIAEEELFAVLDRARAEVERRRTDRRQAVLTRDPNAIKDALLAEVLASPAPPEAGARLCEFLGIHLGPFAVLCVERPASRQSVEEALGVPEGAQVFEYQGHVFVLSPGPGSAADVLRGLGRAGISLPHDGPDQLPQAFEESIGAAHAGFYDAAGGVSCFQRPAAHPVPFPSGAQNKLAACLVTGDRAAAEACARDLLESCRQAGVPLAALEQHLGAMIQHIQETLSPILPDADGLADFTARVMPVHRHGWFGPFAAELVAATGALAARVEQANRTRVGRAVRRAVRHIEDNYSRDLPLEEVARSAGLSPSYFSSCFKRETGRNMVEYITEYRVEKAIELLGSTSRNASEVAYMVGFKDPKYFARIFKRSVGVTPSDYRKYSSGK